MESFHLQPGEVLRGDFSLGPLNLLLVFQVNCPGCFMHALPFATELHERYSAQGLRILALSTAFEDYEFNTLENTRALLDDGQLVGETAAQLGKLGIQRYEKPIPFAVAMDSVEDHSVAATFSRNRLPGTPTWILLDAQSQILARWFGHADPAAVMRLLDDAVGQTSTASK